MLARMASLVVGLLLCIVIPGTALADVGPAPGIDVGGIAQDVDNGTWDLGVGAGGDEQGADLVSDGGPPAGLPPEPYAEVSWSVLGTDDEGEPCQEFVTRSAWTADEFRGYRIIADQAMGEFRDQVERAGLVEPLQACPGATVDMVLQAAIARISGTLDSPVIDLAPDSRAITGLRTFLVTGVDMVQAYPDRVTVQGVGFDVAVELSATHVVDWGDGTVDRGIDVAGEPYDPDDPDPGPQDITHVYTVTGEPTLSVTTTWSVTVTVAGQTRTVAITLPPVSDQVTVQEVRSVRDR